LLAVLALAVAEEDADDSVARREQLTLRDELAPEVRDLRRRSETARDIEAEASHAVALAREEADVVDHGLREIALAARERDLELARQLSVVLVEEEVLRDRVRVGRDVEELVLEDARVGRGRHVADRVCARADGRDAGERELALRL